MDDYPSKYNAYIKRQERWIRGDFQIASWLKNRIITKDNNIKKNPLGLLSKFKILDNLRRSILPIATIISLVFLKKLPILIFTLASYIFPTILDILNYIIFKEGKDLRFIYAHKSFIPNTNLLKASIIRGILEISFLPHKAYVYSITICKAIYRMNFSKKYLLEWTTSEDVLKNSKDDLISSYKSMWINVLFGILSLIYGLSTFNIIYDILSIIWLVGPFISWRISKDIKEIKPIDKIENEDREFLINVCKKIWSYFKDNMNEENNFLPPDNYQEDRNPKIARKNIYNKYRTWIFICNFSI